MKTIAALGLLALSTNAGVVKRQEHSHGGGTTPTNNISSLDVLKSPGSDFFANIAKALPKGGLGAMLNPEVRKAYKIERVSPQMDLQAKRVRTTYGPYKIRASNGKENPGNSISMDPAGTSYNNLAGTDFLRDVIIIDHDSKVVNETFEKAMVEDGIYNHHIIFLDLNKKPESWIACNGKPVPDMPISVFMGSGSEDSTPRYNAESAKIKSGFYVGKTDIITFGLDIVNYQDRERTVYIVNEMEYFDGIPEGYKHAQARIVQMGTCDGADRMQAASNIRPPPGEKKFVLSGKNDIDIIKDGHLTATVGHLHDGGLKTVVTINGKEVCSSKIVYGGTGHEQVQPNGEVWKTIGQTIGCADPIRVSKGDKLQLHAYFDFNEHPPRHSAHGEEAEGMALIGTTFVPL